MTVSDIDILHLKMIRSSVDEFQRIVYSRYCVDASCKILDIAPQVYGGIAALPDCTHEVDTMDIDPTSGATYIHDLCRPIPAELHRKFDVVFCTEVLEHTRQPFNAADSLLDLTKPGGVIAVTTPFNFRIHGPLPDCWRFSEHGLRELFIRASMVSITSVESPDRPLFPVSYQTLVRP